MKCAYKDINNQIDLIECDKARLNSYICQKSISTNLKSRIIYSLKNFHFQKY